MIRPPSRSPVVYLRARSAPYLDVVLKYEAAPVVRVVAESAVDEARLLDWLRHADVVDRLGEVVVDVLDELDEGCA